MAKLTTDGLTLDATPKRVEQTVWNHFDGLRVVFFLYFNRMSVHHYLSSLWMTSFGGLKICKHRRTVGLREAARTIAIR